MRVCHDDAARRAAALVPGERGPRQCGRSCQTGSTEPNSAGRIQLDIFTRNPWKEGRTDSRSASEQKTSGGILLPDSVKDKPARGVVVSVGEGKLDSKGSRHPLQVKPGDRVVFTSYAGEPFKIGDDELLLMREDDILAIVG